VYKLKILTHLSWWR